MPRGVDTSRHDYRKVDRDSAMRRLNVHGALSMGSFGTAVGSMSGPVGALIGGTAGALFGAIQPKR